MISIKVIIVILVSLIIFGALIEQAGYQIHTSSVSNESITFTANNTYVQPSRTPINTITAMYNDSAHSCTYGSGRYDFDAIQGIRVYTNGTLCPSMNLTGAKYIDFTIVKPTGFGAVIMALSIGVLGLVVILKYLGMV